MDTREAIDRGWYYATAPDGALTRRTHGYAARVELRDRCGLAPATWLRAANAAGRWAERAGWRGLLRVVLGPAGTTTARHVEDGVETLLIDGAWVAGSPGWAPVEAAVAAALDAAPPTAVPAPLADLPARPVPRALFFESLMNSDMPHNDREISQGVLHLISGLREAGTEVVLANVKLAITGDERPVQGLESLGRALADGPVGLVCITLLEGYFEGVVSLIRELRRLGCRAHVAVGGVMPTLAPEHVAAHLPDVSFVCRGAGEAFVPALARIVGDGTIDVPLTLSQLRALTALDGVIAIDRAGGALVAGWPERAIEVADLDDVPLDLSYLAARHIEGGIEISTSRGCVHKCTFCSILGRERWQGRSADGIFAVLRAYERRFAELFGEGPKDALGRNMNVPPNAWRVHICDDDFACDRDRTLAFLRGLAATPFRLSSFQVAIGDLCRHEGGRVLPEPDEELLDAIRPELFADHGAPVPPRDYVADHRTRRWSSYLQIGVEAFSDKELVRLGKGYKLAHVRAIAAALDARGVHFDAYFIQSNADTTADDLIDVVEEIGRLKLAYPRHFHVRFPIVPRLVSYFTSASYRRRVRDGTTDVCVLRGLAAVPGHPEWDYPFVDHDRPRDAWVERAVAQGFFTDDGLYLGSLERLAALWRARIGELPADDPERRRGQRLVRRVDDARRSLAFAHLDAARAQGRAGDRAAEGTAVALVEHLLGPRDTWLRALQRDQASGTPRLVVIPTWQCELRCNYCYIPKQDHRVMKPAIVDQALDLLLSSRRDALMLQFFGGEALLEWPLLQHAIATGAARARALGKRLTFVVSSNGWSLDEAKLAWLADYPVKLELSLDGDPETQRRFRPAREQGQDSYANSIAHQAAAIRASGLLYDVIMVVHPAHAHKLAHNFFHLADLGFERLQINFALGRVWSTEQMKAFAAQLHLVGTELRRRRAAGHRLVFVNLENRPMSIRLNAEITVDWDGTVYGGNAFLHETAHKQKFVLGHVDDLGNFDRYTRDTFTNEFLIDWSYPPDVTANNLRVGAIFHSFLKHLYEGPTEAPKPEARPRPIGA